MEKMRSSICKHDYCLAVDRCVPGDVTTVSGIVKVNNSDEGKAILGINVIHDIRYF